MKKINYKGAVAVDIDGVISDFESEFCDRFGYERRDLYSLYERYPNVDPGLIEEFVSSPSSYENLVPIFGGAVALLGTLRARGHYILLMTSRSKKLAEVTREWLEGYEIQYNELWFTKDKAGSIEEFNTMYPSRKVILLVDDYGRNTESLPSGVVGAVWRQPWNEGHFPRIHYNSSKMRIEIQEAQDSEWKPF